MRQRQEVQAMPRQAGLIADRQASSAKASSKKLAIQQRSVFS
ncbi:hypothetical protein PQR62_10685 [Herbaspirillum lusitanum]|uniref:Uncharacterized protein n=1 Tax=Herbaspirillum lusitanum TaxID=213312 RepID=A0ABW9AAE0_9BURK